PMDEPSVIAAAAELVTRLGDLGERLKARKDAMAGCETVFVGQLHGGEIFNQYPQECWLEGTRRWLPGGDRSDVERGFPAGVAAGERGNGSKANLVFRFIRDAFFLEKDDPLVSAFQSSYRGLSGKELPAGPKPFVDDGNCFWGSRKIAAITHGPRAGGQHTVKEWMS